MAWVVSSGRDISHHNTISNYDQARNGSDWFQIKVTESTKFVDDAADNHYAGLAGKPRGPYHFAQPGNLAAQIKHFLEIKNGIGSWERLDMLDCEFSGVTSSFIKSLVAEYRKQSGIQKVLVYVGYSDLTHACDPAGWYDENTPIWAARYRKIGPPAGPDSWKTHLQWDHPGLAIYQWDNAAPLAGAGLTDINSQRVGSSSGGNDMPLNADDLWQVEQHAYGAVRNLIFDMAAGNSPAQASFVALVSQAVAPMFAAQAANAAGGVLDPKVLTETMSAAARQGANDAVTQSVLPAIERIENALADDNVDEAKAIVAEMGTLFKAASGQESTHE